MKKIEYLSLFLLLFLLSSINVSNSFSLGENFRSNSQIGINSKQEILLPNQKIGNVNDWEFLNLQFEISIPVLAENNSVKGSKPHKINVVFLDNFDRDTFFEIFSYEGGLKEIKNKVEFEIKRVAKYENWHWEDDILKAPFDVKCHALY